MKYSHSHAISFIGGHLASHMHVNVLQARLPISHIASPLTSLTPTNVEIDTKFVLIW